MHRSDVGAGDQVVFESLFFSQDCSNFTKVVNGQANPGPVVASIQCLRESSDGPALITQDGIVGASVATLLHHSVADITPATFEGVEATAISDGATCCVPTGTFICSGPVYTNGYVVEFSERDTLETFGPNNAFLNSPIRSLDSSFTENEVYTRQPGACGRWSGATMHRSDVGAGDQVVLEDLFFGPDCSNFTKVVRGQANPGPVVCSVHCVRDAS